MIYRQPDNWKDLQNKVAAILESIGFQVEVEKEVKTPRGSIEIDVWARDNSGTEKITYIIECKNWNKKIPQTVIHSLTTVMHETGVNIGYLISKKGLQSGAEEYLQNTNIQAMTYLEFESRYMQSWWECTMNRYVATDADRLIQYVEPINSFRQRKIESLSQENVSRYVSLSEKYYHVAYFFSYLEIPSDIVQFKKRIKEVTGGELNIDAECYVDSTIEIKDYVVTITSEFDKIFGEKLFVNT